MYRCAVLLCFVCLFDLDCCCFLSSFSSLIKHDTLYSRQSALPTELPRQLSWLGSNLTSHSTPDEQANHQLSMKDMYMYRCAVLLCFVCLFDLDCCCFLSSFSSPLKHVHICTRFGVWCLWWFHYPSLLLHTDLTVSLFIRCTMRCENWAQPAELS